MPVPGRLASSIGLVLEYTQTAVVPDVRPFPTSVGLVLANLEEVEG